MRGSGAKWSTLKKQIPAGQNGCTSGIPYWTLYIGAFLPIFRSHGTDTRREIWHFGEEGDPFHDSIARFTRLRYRLMPYIHSNAAQVTLNDGTIMRLLAFDFPNEISMTNQWKWIDMLLRGHDW